MSPYVRTTAPGVVSRRTLIVSTGVAAVAVAGLAACGADDPAPTASSGGPVSVKTGDIPVGGGSIFAEAQAVVTQPTAGEFKAFSSICTHARCPVTEVTTTINCQCHGSKFALVDGSVVNGPATTGLPAKSVTVAGDTISVSG